MHDVKLSKKITKYCLRDAILRPILFAALAVGGGGNTKQLLILYLNLLAQKRLSEGGDVRGNTCIGDEGETDFMNFDILHEIQSNSKNN
jgi:hypothetical protein